MLILSVRIIYFCIGIHNCLAHTLSRSKGGRLLREVQHMPFVNFDRLVGIAKHT